MGQKSKGNNSKNTQARVIILVHDTLPHCVLYVYQVSLKNISSINAFWYEVVKILTPQKSHFEGVLDFNPHPMGWAQGPDAMERKIILQGIYCPCMNAF